MIATDYMDKLRRAINLENLVRELLSHLFYLDLQQILAEDGFEPVRIYLETIQTDTAQHTKALNEIISAVSKGQHNQ